MTTASIRFLWKEYRTYRDLWLTSLIGAIAFQFVMLKLPTLTNERPTTEGFWILMFFMPVVYALGVASTMFSREHEAGCYQFLRGLPLRPMLSVWLGKMSFAIVSSLVLSVVVSVVTITILRWYSIVPSDLVVGFNEIMVNELDGSTVRSLTSILIFCLLLTLNAIAVGALCSLLIQRPLWSTFVAGAIQFGVLAAARQWAISLDVVSYILVLGCGLLTIPLTRYWLNRPDNAEIFSSELFARNPLRHSGVLAKRQRTGIRSIARGYRHTLWLQVKAVGWVWALAIVSLIVVLLCFMDTEEQLEMLFRWWPTLIGLSTFIGDKSGNSYRFHSERGINPHLVWFHRQISSIALFVGFFFVETLIGQPRNRHTDYVEFLASTAVLSFAAAQFCAQFVKSIVSATFCAFCSYPFMVAWGVFVAAFNLPLTITVLNPAAALVLATFLRTKEWLDDQNTVRRWAVITSLLLFVIPVTYAGIWFHRVTEIPEVSLGIDVAEVAMKSAEMDSRKLELYEQTRAIGATPDDEDSEGLTLKWSELPLPIPELETKWLAENEWALKTGLEAANRPIDNVLSFDPNALESQTDTACQGLVRLSELFVAKARQLEQSDQFTEALDYYCAALNAAADLRPGGGRFFGTAIVSWLYGNQIENLVLSNLVFLANEATNENEILAIDLLLRKYVERQPDWAECIKSEYVIRKSLIESLFMSSEGWNRYATIATLRFMPGEYNRSMRLLNSTTKSSLDFADRIERNMRNGHAIVHELNRDVLAIPYRVVKTSGLCQLANICDWAGSTTTSMAWLENRRRATLITLKLLLWRLRHGSYPETLADLPDVDSLPNDVLFGIPFEYGIASESLIKDLIFQTRYYRRANFDRIAVWEPTRGFHVDVLGARILWTKRTENGDLSTCVFPLPEPRP